MERGDINTGLDQRITYNSYHKATSICEGSDSLAIVYGPDKQRAVARYYVNSTLTRTIYYFGDYEMEVTPSDTIHRHYVRSTTGIAALKVKSGSTDSLYYAGTDHLGSIIALYRNDGSVKEHYSFDAWGRRRNPTDWSYNDVPAPAITERGFTGHEHLDKFGLINMNGRLYDPVLGRFLNADPVIQFPWFTQSFNSYSYVLNNPLIYVDPSGYSAAEATEYPDPYYAYKQWTKIHGYGLGYADFADQFWDNIYEQEANGRWLLNGLGYGSISMSFKWTETINNNYWSIGWDGDKYIGELVGKPHTYIDRSATMQLSLCNPSGGGSLNNFLINTSFTRDAGFVIAGGLNIATNGGIPAATPKYQPKGFNPVVEAKVAKGMKVANGVVGVVGKTLGVLSAVEHGNQAYQAFNSGNIWKGIGYMALTGLDIGLIFIRSNPAVLAGSVIYGVLDATMF